MDLIRIKDRNFILVLETVTFIFLCMFVYHEQKNTKDPWKQANLR